MYHDKYYLYILAMRRERYGEWAQSGNDENEMKHLDRKTDLHGFLYPFTLLAIERKLYLQYLKMTRVFLTRYTQT